MKFNGEIHPVADLFPMLPEDELRDLAEDIKTRGQLQPIMLDSDGRILDGRNRFQACKLAKVEPKFDTYDGDDPDGYALAVNISRRHMTKGQQAIVVAKAARQPGGKKLSTRDTGDSLGVSHMRIVQANVILDFATELADEVLAGNATKFDAAYEIAKQRKKEKLARAEDAESIREEAPDLADAVAEESLTLEAAKEQLRQRQEDEARAERVALIDVLVAESGARTYAERVGAGEITWEEAEGLASKWKSEWLEAADRNHRRIFDILAGWKALTRLLDSPKDSFNKAVLEKLGDNLHGDLQKAVAEMAANATKWNGAI